MGRKIESKLNPTNLNDQIRQVQALLQKTVLKMIQIELDLEKDLKIIQADSGQIEQVLLNLALNASHAMTDKGRITIKTRNVAIDKDIANTHWEIEPGEYALLTISDTGHGIAKEVQRRVFEPFFTTKAPGQGTGLGLSMVYGILKNLLKNPTSSRNCSGLYGILWIVIPKSNAAITFPANIFEFQSLPISDHFYQPLPGIDP